MDGDGLHESRKIITEVDVNDNRYDSLDLERNPFPAGGLAPSNPQYEPWREIREKILDFLKSFLRTKSSRGLMLLGGYGRGKTYHLNYIRAILQESPYKIRIVSINDPGVDPYQIIRRILIEIGEEEIATMIWSILGPELRKRYTINPEYFEPMFRSKSRARQAVKQAAYVGKLVSETIPEEAWSDHRLFFEHIDKVKLLDRKELLSDVVPILTSRDPDSNTFVTEISNVAEDLAAICIFDGVYALERWKALTEGVGKGSIKPGNEVDFFKALLLLLKRSGVDYFVLLLDEFEKVPQLQRMTERDARNYLDTFRMLIDAGQQQLPFAYIVGSVEDAWNVAKGQNASLEHRFDVIDLPTMIDDSIARYTILQYLKSARKKNATFTEKSLHPFPDEFLDLVPASLRITTRQLVKLCYSLIEQAANQKESTISPELVNSMTMDQDTSSFQESAE